MKFLYARDLLDPQSYPAQFVALALLTGGLVSTLGSDDLLAAFAAGRNLHCSHHPTSFCSPKFLIGCAIAWDGHFQEITRNEQFPLVIDTLLNCGCFIYIGAWLPFREFSSPDLGIAPWRLVVLFLAVLALRRIPPILLLYKWVHEIDGWQEALVAGHFGTSCFSYI